MSMPRTTHVWMCLALSLATAAAAACADAGATEPGSAASAGATEPRSAAFAALMAGHERVHVAFRRVQRLRDDQPRSDELRGLGASAEQELQRRANVVAESSAAVERAAEALATFDASAFVSLDPRCAPGSTGADRRACAKPEAARRRLADELEQAKQRLSAARLGVEDAQRKVTELTDHVAEERRRWSNPDYQARAASELAAGEAELAAARAALEALEELHPSLAASARVAADKRHEFRCKTE
ncbi:MAG: hypothetical protein R2939_02425 [Kofleriaceae bacterium]